MKPGDLVLVAFGSERSPGIIIHMSRNGTYNVLIDGVIHRATDTMLSLVE